MAEYIEREALIEWFRPYTHEDVLLEPIDVIGDIRAIPAADAVEVVRCKDCKHMEISETTGGRYCYVWEHFNGAGDDGFCNYGERMADNETD